MGIPEKFQIPISDITELPEFDIRDRLNEEAIMSYADNKVYFSNPIRLYEITDKPDLKEQLILVCGRHRLAAARRNGEDTVPCYCFKATWEEALEEAIKDNTEHGVQYTESERKRACETLIKAKPGMSHSWYAKRCGINDKTVARIRKALEDRHEIPIINELEGEDGKVRAKKQEHGSRPDKAVDLSIRFVFPSMSLKQVVLDAVEENKMLTGTESDAQAIANICIDAWSGATKEQAQVTNFDHEHIDQPEEEDSASIF